MKLNPLGCYGTFEVLSPDGDATLFGADATAGVVRVPLPSVESIEDETGRVRFAPCKQPAQAAPLPQGPELAWLIANAPRHERGTACTDPAGIARRLAAIEKLEPVQIPPRAVIDQLDVGARVIECMSRRVFESFGLAPADVPALTLRSLFLDDRGKHDGAGSYNDAELATILERAATDAKGCIYPFDAEGASLDAIAAREESARVASLAQHEEQERRENEPNLKSAVEMGIAVVAVPHVAPIRPAFAHGHGAYSDASRRYYFIRQLVGVEFPAGPVHEWCAEVLPAWYVPACTKREAATRAINLTPNELAPLFAKRSIERGPVTAFHSKANAEGRIAIEHARKLLASIAREAYEEALSFSQSAGMRGGYFGFAVELLVRACAVRPDLARQLMAEAFLPFWKSEAFHPTILKYGYPLFEDADGNSSKPSRTDDEGRPVDDKGHVLTKRWVEPVYSTKPVLPPMCNEKFETWAAKPIRGEGLLRFSPGELVATLDPGTIAQVAASIGVDEWAEKIASLLVDRSEVTTEELEAVIGAKLNKKEPAQRLAKIMDGFEWIYRRLRGRRVWQPAPMQQPEEVVS